MQNDYLDKILDDNTQEHSNNEQKNKDLIDNKELSTDNNLLKLDNTVIIKKKRPTFLNKNNQRKLYEDEVLQELSSYNDFNEYKNYGKTRFDIEFKKLQKQDKIVNIKKNKSIFSITWSQYNIGYISFSS